MRFGGGVLVVGGVGCFGRCARIAGCNAKVAGVQQAFKARLSPKVHVADKSRIIQTQIMALQGPFELILFMLDAGGCLYGVLPKVAVLAGFGLADDAHQAHHKTQIRITA